MKNFKTKCIDVQRQSNIKSDSGRKVHFWEVVISIILRKKLI